MANKKISDFTSVSSLDDAALLLVSVSGVTYNVTGAVVKALCLSGAAYIDTDGYWHYYDQTTHAMVKGIKAQGAQGAAGTPGANGTNGANAPTITGMSINASYHLIVTLSDGSSYDAGYCRGASGSGTGDMQASVYDPQNKAQDIFAFVTSQIADKYSASNPPPYPVTSVNGKTGAVTVDSDDMFIINNTGSAADKTFAEITAAFNSGKICVLIQTKITFNLVRIDSTSIQFDALDLDSTSSSTGGTKTIRYVICDSNNNWTNLFKYLVTTSTICRNSAVDAADTNYTTLMARGESLHSADTTPSVNGAICWTYG